MTKFCAFIFSKIAQYKVVRIEQIGFKRKMCLIDVKKSLLRGFDSRFTFINIDQLC